MTSSLSDLFSHNRAWAANQITELDGVEGIASLYRAAIAGVSGAGR